MIEICALSIFFGEGIPENWCSIPKKIVYNALLFSHVVSVKD
jgi:hypothetical protein